jgi:DNA-binding LytR/AlgR family response regulator
MSKIMCLIVDDEPLALDLIEGYVKQTPFLELIGRCSNAFEAMLILNTQKVDLLFLDIQMPELSGMEFSRMLGNKTKVIFTTAYEKYAVEGYKVDALGYLLKPFNMEEFLHSAFKAKEWFQMANLSKPSAESDYIFVKSDYKQVKIILSDVLYFEGLKDYVKIHLAGQTWPILSLISLKHLEEQLSDVQFMRLHRSFIVNLNKIEAIERGCVIINKNTIPVADNYKERFQQYITSKSINL